MVDELTQESFQTGKAIVTVSVDLITAIAEACKRSEEKNPGMSAEQKETLLGKVVDKVVSNYKETCEPRHRPPQLLRIGRVLRPRG